MSVSGIKQSDKLNKAGFIASLTILVLISLFTSLLSTGFDIYKILDSKSKSVFLISFGLGLMAIIVGYIYGEIKAKYSQLVPMKDKDDQIVNVEGNKVLLTITRIDDIVNEIMDSNNYDNLLLEIDEFNILKRLDVLKEHIYNKVIRYENSIWKFIKYKKWNSLKTKIDADDNLLGIKVKYKKLQLKHLISNGTKRNTNNSFVHNRLVVMADRLFLTTFGIFIVALITVCFSVFFQDTINWFNIFILATRLFTIMFNTPRGMAQGEDSINEDLFAVLHRKLAFLKGVSFKYIKKDN